MQKRCQIPTPIEYVRIMLDAAGYVSDLFGKRILENSCGEGNILCEIVRRYISDCRSSGLSGFEICKGLAHDIVGYEIDAQSVEVCTQRLNQLLKAEGIPAVSWNICQRDYLKSESNGFHFIVGNPPYVTYHDLDVETREFLRNNFESCKNGRFDYFYAFTEKSYATLEENGIMVYLIPFSLFRNKFAISLREILRNDLISVVDCSETAVFSGVTTSVAIIKVIKGSDAKKVRYFCQISGEQYFFDKNSLSEKWFFAQDKDGKRFGDYFQIKNSVATLCNKAFLITEYEEADDYIILGNYKIEKKLVRTAVSTKSCKKQKPTLIIFPYRLGNSRYEHFSEAEFQQIYPEASKYMKSFADDLSKRKVSEGVLWFEYGRTQAINDVDGEKLIIPMVITTKVTAYRANDKSVPYAGYFIKAKTPDQYNLDFAKTILESPEFFDYVKTHGTPTTGSSYRIPVEEIANFTFGGKQ
ncbi:MAG: N-6 DNA methylase [Synergistaceae bacterium]|nr:N-6 DNA methylase [Synergistaceae bacterium]